MGRLNVSKRICSFGARLKWGALLAQEFLGFQFLGRYDFERNISASAEFMAETSGIEEMGHSLFLAKKNAEILHTGR